MPQPSTTVCSCRAAAAGVADGSAARHQPSGQHPRPMKGPIDGGGGPAAASLRGETGSPQLLVPRGPPGLLWILLHPCRGQLGGGKKSSCCTVPQFPQQPRGQLAGQVPKEVGHGGEFGVALVTPGSGQPELTGHQQQEDTQPTILLLLPARNRRLMRSWPPPRPPQPQSHPLGTQREGGRCWEAHKISLSALSGRVAGQVFFSCNNSVIL